MYVSEGQDSGVRQGHNSEIGRKGKTSFILKISEGTCNLYEETHCTFDIA